MEDIKKGAKAFASGAAQGLTFGFMDEITAGLMAGYDTVTGSDKPFGENYETYRDIARNEDKQIAEENPVMAGAGEIVGAIGTGVGTAGLAAKGAMALGGSKALGLGASIAQSAFEGGLYSAGATEQDLTSSEGLSEIGTGAAIGGGVAGALPIVGRGISKLMETKPVSKALTSVSKTPIVGKFSDDAAGAEAFQKYLRDPDSYANDKLITDKMEGIRGELDSMKEQARIGIPVQKEGAGVMYDILDPMVIKPNIDITEGMFKVRNKRLGEIVDEATNQQPKKIQELLDLKRDLDEMINWGNESSLSSADKRVATKLRNQLKEAQPYTSQKTDEYYQQAIKAKEALEQLETKYGSKSALSKHIESGKATQREVDVYNAAMRDMSGYSITTEQVKKALADDGIVREGMNFKEYNALFDAKKNELIDALPIGQKAKELTDLQGKSETLKSMGSDKGFGLGMLATGAYGTATGNPLAIGYSAASAVGQNPRKLLELQQLLGKTNALEKTGSFAGKMLPVRDETKSVGSVIGMDAPERREQQKVVEQQIPVKQNDQGLEKYKAAMKFVDPNMNDEQIEQLYKRFGGK